MDKVRVLFVCIHNSARSQMAEAYLNNLAGDKYFAESAGIEPGKLNPNVVKVMKEDEIDISGNKIKDVFEFYKKGRLYNYVITVCDKTAAERCPVFPGVKERINWSFPDPSKLEGTEEEVLMGTKIIRNQIKEKVKEWIEELEEKKKGKE